jgi:hypothetical protein
MPFFKKLGSYLPSILESYQTIENKSTHHILYSLSKVDHYKPEQLRSLEIKLYGKHPSNYM